MSSIVGRLRNAHAPANSTPGSRAQSSFSIPESKAYVVDDDESIRFLMRTLMVANGIGVETFATAEEFLEFYRPEYPGCLVLDIHMPGMSGLELQDILNKKGVPIPIIFFTAQGSVPRAVQALKNGAVDFIEKPFDYKELVKRIEASVKLDAENRRRKNACLSIASRLASLTPREREVMERIIAGRLNKIIADELNICVKTVEFHRARIMEKTGVHSVAELVQMTLSSQDANTPRTAHS
jgi:FixJ family two-component response regulator